jgi:hypothetical protein
MKFPPIVLRILFGEKNKFADVRTGRFSNPLRKLPKLFSENKMHASHIFRTDVSEKEVG